MINKIKINKYIFILLLIFITTIINYKLIYLDVKAVDDYWSNNNQQTTNPGVDIGDTSNPNGDYSTSGSGTSNSNSSFKPIDISGMKEKKPTKEQNDAAQIIQITAKGQGGDDTSYHGLSDIAVFNRSNSAITNLFEVVKKWSNIFLGLAVVFGLVSTVALFIQLGVYSSNPNARANIIRKLTIVFIATILSTFVSVLFNLFMNIFFRK